MANIILQSGNSRKKGIHYQYNPSDVPIGEGGMGKVYKGQYVDECSGSTRPVAIKSLYLNLPESAYERARRESQIRLRNDNLVEMIDFVETEEIGELGDVRKRYFVISELLVGVSLSDVLEGKTKGIDNEDIPFAVKMLQEYKNDPEHFAITIVRNVLSGLLALHDAGYIHRDIDPSNIMLTVDEHVKLIDFGIAKQMNTLTTGDKALTVAGKFMGKPEYASPELALGDISHQNQTTDIYAVGILLYQCIIGHTPFEGTRYEILEYQLKNKLPLSKIKNRSLRKIIATACEKRQEYRYQTAAQMRVALENLSGRKRPISPFAVKLMFGGVAIVIILFATILFAVKQKQQKEREKDRIAAIEAKLEQERQKKINKMEISLTEAELLYQKGVLQDEDDFDQYLLSAYSAYSKCLERAQNDSVLMLFSDRISAQMDSVLFDIKRAKDTLQSKAVDLEKLKEMNYSKQYQAKVDSLDNFITKHTCKK